ncbi:ribbon-helix-helix domain-containing protein [Candidatus Bathycorpusculum sp.]|uniref:ribbon-helix-helix domain-containing protein n=1 Tax=Candidatus Bathycorpusculum sp. TaxID=2994959 RepID=UPI0028340727|nr:ribbon-helix-helix domain-containing protein [Candidatus Termitimicrobium sp.]MCL2685928.1 ribbon-helix-helix domain-containing protein [Candidatus Termitimicrobium sp.]
MPNDKPRNYTTTTIPNHLMARVDAVVASEKYGYQNRSDFILEAIREKLRKIGYLE